MKTKAIIPAQPGFYGICTYEINEEGGRGAARVAIVAWEICEFEPNKTRAYPVLDHSVFDCSPEFIEATERPDGTVVDIDGLEYRDIDQFYKHNDQIQRSTYPLDGMIR